MPINIRDIAPESVVFLGSPVEGIFLVANALLEHGDEVIVLSPGYDALRNVFEYVVGEGNLKTWSFAKHEDSWKLYLDDLRELISQRTKMLVVNFPHNPTGHIPTQQFQTELSEIAKEFGITLFCDEIYFGLVHNAENEIPSMIEVNPDSIVLSGLSKTYGLPGLRAGWLIIKDNAMRESVVNWKHYTSLCPAAPSQFLAEIALAVLPELKKRSLGIIENNLIQAAEFFRRWRHLFTWYPPKAGSTALVECKIQPVSDFAIRLAKEANVLILPSVGLGMDDDHFRIGLGRKNFSDAIAHLDSWLMQHLQIEEFTESASET